MSATKNLLAGEYTLAEGLNWFAEKATSFVLGIIPDNEGVTILIERMRADVDEKMEDWQHAAKYVDRLVNLSDPAKGKIPERKAYLARLDKQGAEYGERWAVETDPEKKAGLKIKMDNYSGEMDAVEAEIKGFEAELVTRRDTMNLREETYQKAALELKNFERMAPMMIEHTAALKAAKADKMEALKEKQEKGSTNAKGLLAKLEEMNDDAISDLSATVHLEDEVATTAFDVSADLDAEEKVGSTEDRVTRWTSK